MNEAILFRNVLLIEDDPSHAMLIKRALRSTAADISHVASLEEAYTQIRQGAFDLIITDLNLPDSSGIDHIQTLKEKTQGLPLIVLTSSSDLHIAIEAMKKGAEEFIVKNFDRNFEEVLFLSISRLYAGRLLVTEKLRIQSETQILRVAIENSADAMAIAANDGKILYANRAFLSFVSKYGGNSKNLLTILSPRVNDSESLSAGFKKNLTDLNFGGVWHSELTLVDDKDSAFDISLSLVAADQTVKDSKKFVIWIKDISEQKRREKFQREILSTTTHDLKGPLGAILLSCELLLNMLDNSEKLGQLVLRIDSSARNAINLIDEFLSARRIQEGTFVLKPAEYDILSLSKDIVAEYSNMALARGIELLFLPESDVLRASVDKLAYARIIGNLLSNALKFTAKGGRVEVSCSDGVKVFRVSIKDNGSGMEPSEVKSIFERFTRLEKHNDVVGSGIGLFIVKSLVAAHGGKIEVTSAPSIGTSFDIFLPKSPPINERGELIALDFK